MAYLNVPKRRVETTIAYVGPLGSGKATNLEQLALRSIPNVAETERRTDEHGEALVLDWVATADAYFRDCSLAVKLVAPKSPTPEQIRRLVQDSDGVVLVLDAEPGAATENVRFASMIREALASSTKPLVPVVVQVNKSDLPNARTAHEVAEELGTEWSHLGASALSGDGVLPTLERVLEAVLAGLRRDDAVPTVMPAEEARANRAEGNPLLAALKQVLRDTVREHVAELERSFEERLARGLEETMANQKQTTDALGSLRVALADESARMVAAITAVAATSASHGAVLGRLDAEREDGRALELLTLLSSRMDTLAMTLAAHGSALEGIDHRVRDTGPLKRIGAHVEALETAVSTLEKKAVAPIGGEIAKIRAETSKGIEDLATQLPRASHELRADLLRALDVRSRTDREHASATAIALQAAIDAVTLAVGRSDGHEKLNALTEAVGGLRTDLSSLRTETVALKSLEAKLQESTRNVQRDLRESVGARVKAIDATLRELATNSTASDARTEEMVEDLRARFADLLAELKKKKSWFT